MKNEPNTLFQTLAPDMMRPSRILVIDHDVTRYHSFDLLTYTLYRDSLTGNVDRLSTLRSDYFPMLDPDWTLDAQVQFARTHIAEYNVFDCFGKSVGTVTGPVYEERINDMLRDPDARIVPTNVSSDLGIIFQRNDISGVLLRYRSDPHRPDWVDSVTVYEHDRILTDVDHICAIIIKENVNAVMLSGALLAIALAERLLQHGYRKNISWMLARYAYNFDCADGKMWIPLYNEEFGRLEAAHRHEYGFFDPFSHLTQRVHEGTLVEKLPQEENEDGHTQTADAE